MLNDKNILEKIYKSGLKFLVPLSLDETYELIVHEAVKMIGAEFGTIYIAVSGQLEKKYASSPLLYKIKPRKGGHTYKAFKSKKPIILSYKDIERIHPEFKATKARSDIIIPLHYRGKSIGVLSFQSSKDNFFTKKDLNVLNLFVPMATLAIIKSQLYDETQRAINLRDTFISMASHELRTPLTSVSGYIQLLSTKMAGSNSIESKWVEQLVFESQRLTNLVKELLEVNNIQRGRLQYVWRECSISEIINRAIRELRFTFPEHRLSFSITSKNKSDVVVGDFDKLLQAFINLIENALKFSPKKAEINIILRVRSQHIDIEIKDQGRGIEKQYIDKIFESFYKIDDLKQGMGLGLFLAKDIIERHKGKIKLYSKQGKGTAVKICLPLATYG